MNGCRVHLRLLLLIGVVFLISGTKPAFAQGVSSSAAAILGTVTDSSGAVVPGVTVTVTSTDTGISQSATTDKDGRYAVRFLSPGPYSLTVTAKGFKTQTQSGIVLTIGQQAVINVGVQVGQRVDVITVTSNAPLVDTVSSSTSYLVNSQTMRDLPLNGRDFLQLATLQPGVSSISGISGNSEVTTGGSAGNTNGGKFSVNGLPSKAITYLLDGSDVSDPFGLIPTMAGVSGAALGVDAIQEFRIITDNYSAEYGRHAGGVVEAITRGGTNSVHGGVFDFLRNSAMDARNFFDDPTQSIPEFRRNQFGGFVGGPIVKDKTFFFADYEGVRELLGNTVSFVSPDAASRQGILPGGNVTVSPLIVPYLNAYPLPNGADLGDGTGIVNTSLPQPINEDYFLVRIDHKLTERDQLFARYLIDDGRSPNPLESTVVPGFGGSVQDRNQFFAFGEHHSFASPLINSFEFSFNRQKALGLPGATAPDLVSSLIPGQPLGQIETFGLPTIGNVFTLPIGEFNNIIQVTDSLAWSKGKHFLKFGGDVRHIQNNGPFSLGFLAEYEFPDLSSFLQAEPSLFLGAAQGHSDSDRGYRITDWGFYVQDDFRVSSKLTINAGLRYEGSSDPSEAHGQIANIINPLTATSTTAGKLLNSPKVLFGPRIGLAWSPDGKTAIRAGYGIFYSFLSINEYSDTRFMPPYYQLDLSIAPPFLDPLSGPVVIPGFGITVPTQYNYEQPTVQEFNLSVQRSLSQNLSFQAAYVGSRGDHMLRSGNINTPVPSTLPDGQIYFSPTAPRINPNFGAELYISTDAESEYNALQLSLQKRISAGLQLQASYTYSKSIDDSSGPFLSDFVTETGPVQYYACRTCDRAVSAWDMRNNFVINALYDLPFGHGKQFGADAAGATERIFGGWQIGGIFTLHSGLPFTPTMGYNSSDDGSVFLADRPNVVGPCKIIGNPSKWFDPSCFAVPLLGTYGSAGRNILLGPNFKDFDFFLSKEASITERLRVQFRAEFFNIANHPNFAPPINSTGFNGLGGNGDIIFNQGSTTPLASAGEIFSTTTTSRQIQFGLKFLF
ncbi:MAG: TonB-dependent receptor [Candidatus Acidiferrales bacterium]